MYKSKTGGLSLSNSNIIYSDDLYLKYNNEFKSAFSIFSTSGSSVDLSDYYEAWLVDTLLEGYQIALTSNLGDTDSITFISEKSGEIRKLRAETPLELETETYTENSVDYDNFKISVNPLNMYYCGGIVSSTGTILTSFGTDGFTVLAVPPGAFVITFTTPKSDTNYIVQATPSTDGSTTPVLLSYGGKTTDNFGIYLTTHNNSLVDTECTFTVIFKIFQKNNKYIYIKQ